MTVPTPIQQRIRILDARRVCPGRRISREVGVSRQTVRKYAQLEDCSPEPPARPAAGLEARPVQAVDRQVVGGGPVHAAQAAAYGPGACTTGLVEEQGFDGSYQIVQRYVKRWRQEHRLPGDGYLELEWSPGVMQADFGLAQAVVAGSRTDVHCLVASFPYSNMRYAVALPGENAECVCEGLARGVRAHRRRAAGAGARQRHRRGAPGLVGQDRGGGGVPEVRRASPDRGQVLQSGRGQREGQRGENAVGFLRRNVMVPLPNAESHAQLTRFMLSRCDRIAEDPHYRKGEPVRDLFARDREAMAPMPGTRFDACRWEVRQGRRRGMRGRGLAPLSRGSVVARVDARRRAARVRRGDPHP